MINPGGRIFKVYSGIMEIVFYIFLFFTLSFGRSFSALHINTPFLPLFVTEIFLLLNFPLLIYKFQGIVRLPRVFAVLLVTFFLVGFCYLSAGIFKLNIFALRDINLVAYILFLPVTFIIFNDLNRIKFLITVILFSNLFNLFLGFGLFMMAYPLGAFYNLVFETKIFNLGLYYGITISFLVSFYEYIKSKPKRLLALIILYLNVFIIVVSAMSSIWVATLLLFIFLVSMLRVRFLKSFGLVIPAFILVTLCVFYSKPAICMRVYNEAKGFNLFFKGIPKQGEPMKTSSEVEVASALVFKYSEPVKAFPEVRAVPAKVIVQDESLSKLPKSRSVFGNIAWRFGIWKQTLEFTSDSLLIGKGFGVYPVYDIWGTQQYPRGIYLDSGIVPVHNHIITVFFKMGILGLSLFLFLNIYVFFYAITYIYKCKSKFMNNLLIALLGAFVFWHSLALFFDVIDSPPTSIFLWIIMGLIFAVIETDKNHAACL
jgi:hypothetical protein